MTVFVAVLRNRRIVGTVAVKRVSSAHAHLRGMAVVPRYEGQGVASALLTAALRHARKDGPSRVTLETTAPLRRATRFYLDHGFRPTGRTRHWGGMQLFGFERTARRRVVRGPSSSGPRSGAVESAGP